jgi:hypothetical protein
MEKKSRVIPIGTGVIFLATLLKHELHYHSPLLETVVLDTLVKSVYI